MSAATDHNGRVRKRMNSRLILLALTLIWTLTAALLPANAAGFGAYKADVSPADVFPGADRFGPFEGKPAAAAAYKRDKLLGYVFESSDIGYSGKPIKILTGLDNEGTVVGAKVTEHHEPILLIGIPQKQLFDFVGRYVGRNVRHLLDTAGTQGIDVISGATVTAVVINDGLPRQALAVAKSRGLAGYEATAPGGQPGAAVETMVLADVPFEAADWETLLGDGSVRRLHLSNEEVDAAFEKAGVTGVPYEQKGAPEETFIDLYLALASVESVGRSLLSPSDYADAKSAKGNTIVIGANGSYSFRGSGFVRGGIFDRIQLIQDDTTVLFRDKDYRRLDHFEADGSPTFKEIGLFHVPASAKFDPAKPFRLELLVQRQVGAIKKAFTSFSLPYQLPSRLVTKKLISTPQALAQPQTSQEAAAPQAHQEEASANPIWVKIWRSRALDIAILGLSLVILTVIFFLQDWLVKYPLLFTRLRRAFLIFSVLWLGVYAKAQLSVVNIFTFSNSIMTEFRWDFFLLEPLIFMLWCTTAVSLLFWGRGAYCGWLCPFGSLQELLNEAARRLGIRQITVPYAWHERLSAIKYVLFLALFGVALGNMAFAEQLSEIEPFKTVVLLRFMRDWPFVIFALALLGAGLFIERFYCRYLCVLGAGLAIPGRARMFDWLKRRKQCGYECQLCAKKCRVQAIHPLGEINPHECIYCMGCQVIYWDDHACPPLIMKREKRGKKSALKAPPLTISPPGDPATTNGTTAIPKEKSHAKV